MKNLVLVIVPVFIRQLPGRVRDLLGQVVAANFVRALGIDHKLFVVRVFVEPCGGLQELRPALIAAGDLCRRMVGHLRIRLYFCGHWDVLLSVMGKWREKEQLMLLGCSERYANQLIEKLGFENIYHPSAFKELLLISKHEHAILIKIILN